MSNELERLREAAQHALDYLTAGYNSYLIEGHGSAEIIGDLSAALSAPAQLRPEDDAETFIQAAVDRSPEPLRRLGEWLANKLDGDDWNTAERFLLGAALAAPAQASAPTEPHLGWLYTNPDAGNEWSEQHPIESGECEDAADVFPATLENLKNELICAWQELNAARDEASPPAPAQGDAEAVAELLEEFADAVVAYENDRDSFYRNAAKAKLDDTRKAVLDCFAPSPAPEAEKLREALRLMLAHSCVADAGPDMKSEEDHAAERAARAALKEKAP